MIQGNIFFDLLQILISILYESYLAQHRKYCEILTIIFVGEMLLHIFSLNKNIIHVLVVSIIKKHYTGACQTWSITNTFVIAYPNLGFCCSFSSSTYCILLKSRKIIPAIVVFSLHEIPIFNSLFLLSTSFQFFYSTCHETWLANIWKTIPSWLCSYSNAIF